MAISFFSLKQFDKILKVTIQKTGRLGFTSQTAKEMSIDTNSYFRFGKDEDIDADLILVKLKEKDDDAFRAIKSGDYYYLQTTPLFDFLEYNYKKENIFFDVRRAAHLDAETGGETYLMTRRASKGRRNTPKKESATATQKDPTLELPLE